jgi:ferredoxin/flavodoxin---NADP+ reductase
MTAPRTEDVYDLTIIGAGPVGLFGAFYAGLREARVKLIDSLGELGGQVAALYPEKYIYDVGGFPKILGRDLVRNLTEQGLQFGAKVCLSERVTGLRHFDDKKLIRLRTEPGHEHWSRTVIISAGVGAFAPKKLALPELARFEDRGIYYFVKERKTFEGLRVLIVGGGDSALDWALTLHGVAKSVTLVHRRDRFRAHEGTLRKVREETDTDIQLFHEVKALHGDERLAGATIFDNQTLSEQELAIDAVVLSLGFQASLGPMDEWGLNVEKNMLPVSPRMETNIPGVYAAGDVASHPAKIKLIATGFGEIATAVNFAMNYLDPKTSVNPGHSSSLDLAARGSRTAD